MYVDLGSEVVKVNNDGVYFSLAILLIGLIGVLWVSCNER